MLTANKNPKIEQDDSICDLIADYSLSGFSVSEGLIPDATLGSFFQIMRELGLPAECFNRIVGTITETAIRTRCHFKPGSPEAPVHIGLFCQRKTIKAILHSGNRKEGGWGYYVIERGRDMPGSSHEEYDCRLELYLYKECEK
jgi:hypothetical protein